LFDDDEIDEFVLLDKILGRILKINKIKFVESMSKNYSEKIEPLKSLLEGIIRKENVHNIDEWQTRFLERKHSLTLPYLRCLSIMYNLIFIPCTVKLHRDNTYIFSPTKAIIDLSASLSSTKATIHVIINNSNDSNSTESIKGIFVACEVALNYIYNQLESVTDRRIKIDLLNRIALHYQHQAEKLDRIHHLEALQQWSRAQKFYLDSLKLNRKHLTAMLEYAKCLIMLGKYTVAKQFLLENADERTYFFRDSAERWFLLAIVRRKLQNYNEAMGAIKEALKLRKNYKEAENELSIISRLKRETITKRIEYCKQMNLLHVEPSREQYNGRGKPT
jgi:tetratricopeptide (TPR) repeat protein